VRVRARARPLLMALQLWSGLPLGCGEVAAAFRDHSDEQVFHNSRELTCLTNKYQYRVHCSTEQANFMYLFITVPVIHSPFYAACSLT